MRLNLLLIFCMLGLLVSAEEKKIALLQPRVAEGSDSCKTIEINMVRGELRKSLGWQSDFQVLTRMDVDLMLQEHGFQSSGIVDESQRRQLGVMTGAQYICVSTISKYGTQLYIEAYFVDVETGQMSNPASQLANIKEGDYSMLATSCNNLAKEMLGEVTSTHADSRKTESQIVEAAPPKEVPYVDLGLPSGTLWKNEDEPGFYSYNDAISQFNNCLPTKEQFEELKTYCSWTWTGRGYKVVGQNGKNITLSAAGLRYCDGRMENIGSGGYYWSASLYGSAYAWTINFTSGGIFLSESRLCGGRSIRLVK